MVSGTENGGDGEACVVIKTIVLDGEESFFDIGWKTGEFYRGAVFVLINLVENLAISSQNLSG